MSLEHLRKLKLFKKLDQQSQKKTISRLSHSNIKRPTPSYYDFVRRLNKSKKHMIEQQRNTQIQRSNRILYQKIAGHFKDLQQQIVHITDKRIKKKKKLRTVPNKNQEYQRYLDLKYKQEMQEQLNKQKQQLLFKEIQLLKSRSKTENFKEARKSTSHLNKSHKKKSFYLNPEHITTQTPQHQHQNKKSTIQHEQSPSNTNQNSKTLFYGMDKIDNIELKIKVILTPKIYYIMAKNHSFRLVMEMTNEDYMKLHNGELAANPCNIFKYLQIRNNQLRFRKKKEEVKQKQKIRHYKGLPYRYI